MYKKSAYSMHYMCEYNFLWKRDRFQGREWGLRNKTTPTNFVCNSIKFYSFFCFFIFVCVCAGFSWVTYSAQHKHFLVYLRFIDSEELTYKWCLLADIELLWYRIEIRFIRRNIKIWFCLVYVLLLLLFILALLLFFFSYFLHFAVSHWRNVYK